ncbi:MAG TPA: hypothetical protein VG890_13250 [Puia sp.]|nr:hypothetical protein [Puia sp.]
MKIKTKVEAQKAWVYRRSYRPTTNIYHFFKDLMIVLLEGQSPYGSSHNFGRRKK